MVDVQHYYDDFSKTYDEQRRAGYHALVDDIEASLVLEHLGPSSRVLEVGCGTGQILSRLARDASVIGVDLSREMLGPAKMRGFTVTQASALTLPFDDETFDVVCSFKVLAHVVAIEAAIREAARVVKSGGVLVLEFYNPLSIRYLVKRVVGPRQTGRNVSEADVATRWDLPWRLERYFPDEVSLERLSGVRVLTPAALALRIPVFGGLLEAAERWATRSPAGWAVGGFVVAIARKR